MTTIEKIISSVCEMIEDKRYYYSKNRENEYAVDCSWLLIRAIAKYLPVNNATYTGNMVKELCNTGYWQAIPFDIGKAQRGDIFVRHEHDDVGHAVMYLGNNKIGEACSKKIGLRICNYYFNRYQYILRLKEIMQTKMSTIRKGDICIEVGLLQMFLNKYENNKLVLDCNFGFRTFEAVKNFQTKYSLEIDGIVGGETWAKIYSIMVQSS